MVSRFAAGLVVLVVASSTAVGQAKTPAKNSSSSKSSSASAAAPVRLIVAPTGNEARYRVREQLVGFDLPNDAVGVTQEITGGLLLDSKGAVVRDSSKIVVTLTSLKSDQARRDNFVKTRTMETEKFPTVELVLTGIKGNPKPTATAPTTFELLADLTVKGVTRPTTWKVTARADGADIVGSASTAFTFKDFSIEQPKVRSVLSVADTIKLEYDFRFTAATTSAQK